jgi:hypothetical protein
MSFDCPSFAAITDAQKQSLRYVWDDTRASMDFKFDVPGVHQAVAVLSHRAQMVLCVGLYEWIVWRFEGLHTRVEPLQIAKAAWCATVDARYAPYFELDREQWTGPVLGPLWCAATFLEAALSLSEDEDDVDSLEGGLEYLAQLALHVTPVPERLTAWLRATLQRFTSLFPAPAEDPFADLFNEQRAQRRGVWIAREALDPEVPYTAAMGEPLMSAFLTWACGQAQSNPFIESH